MAKGQSSELTKLFVARMEEVFQNETSARTIILRIIKDGLIPEKEMRNYMLCHDFGIECARNGGRITDATYVVSEKYNIEPRTAERIIQYWRQRLPRIGGTLVANL